MRRHLEYAESVWNPHYMYLIDDLEKVQKRATKILRQSELPAASEIFESTNTGI